MVSLGHSEIRRVVLGRILNTQTLTKTDKQKKMVLSKFAILYWAAFIAILARMWPSGQGVYTPALGEFQNGKVRASKPHSFIKATVARIDKINFFRNKGLKHLRTVYLRKTVEAQ